MLRTLITAVTTLMLTASLAQAQTAAPAPAPAAAPAAARAPISTTKVEGTDNVYIFRNGFHQSIFVVTSEGVIATDPGPTADPPEARPTWMRSGR